MQTVKRFRPTGAALARRIAETAEKNKHFTPQYNATYACETCGNTTVSCPQTDRCFLCGADDFLPIEAWELGPEFFKVMAKYAKKFKEGYFFTQNGQPTIRKDRMYWHAIKGEVYRYDGEDSKTANGKASTAERFRMRGTTLKDSWLAYSPGAVNDVPKQERPV